MPRTWAIKLCVPLAAAAVLAGCGSGRDQSATDHAAASSGQQQITISGCLGAGIGTDQLMLTEVQLGPIGQPPSVSSITGNTFTPGSQVRLAMDRDRLEQFVGQRVTVTGTIKDDGRNTIGTSGNQQSPSGQMEPRDDKSQAATQQHHSEKVADEAGPMGQRSMNNGTFPEVAVSRIDGSGEKCQSRKS